VYDTLTEAELEALVNQRAALCDKWLDEASANLEARDRIDATWTPAYQTLRADYNERIAPALAAADKLRHEASAALIARYDAVIG
jgi:hypothetical protein